MTWIRSITAGFFQGRGKAWAAVLFFASSWLLSTLALRPMNAGLHQALDGAPAAKDLLGGGGLDLYLGMALRQPAFFAGSFSLLLPLLGLYALLALYLTAGLYGFAASQEGPACRAFFDRSRRFFAPFALGFLLNLVFWALIAGLAVLAISGAWRATKDATDPAVHWQVFLAAAVLLALVFNYFRASVGFFQARYALTDGREGMGRCFLASLKFVFKRLIQVNALAWLFTALHVLVLWLAVFALSPGYATPGRWAATALLLQAGYFSLAFLRVAEARSQVEYARCSLEAAPQPDRVEAPPAVVPEEPAPASDAPVLEVDSGKPAP